ncbi:hypothetical protein PY650_34430 [Rhizobium calliandrae]|uniref:Glycoside hydrolase family 19 catalytic domain-containing protein n=1 Tax=Rhizobium calliandrae TaxID=1312182 RepID=A0ABT7KPM4_9HYPH|nr:hypothetical protein [Rhizobium calliandrae]MDL2410586.1 hypothetical protein [Rhizobium calliandrae]
MGNCNEASNDGWRNRGRGFVQITGNDDYSKFSKILGVEILGNPDLAFNGDIAAKIIVIRMRDGVFTGHELSNYFEPDLADWVGVRHIVSGQDNAQQIANFRRLFNTKRCYRSDLQVATAS